MEQSVNKGDQEPALSVYVLDVVDRSYLIKREDGALQICSRHGRVSPKGCRRGDLVRPSHARGYLHGTPTRRHGRRPPSTTAQPAAPPPLDSPPRALHHSQAEDEGDKEGVGPTHVRGEIDCSQRSTAVLDFRRGWGYNIVTAAFESNALYIGLTRFLYTSRAIQRLSYTCQDGWWIYIDSKYGSKALSRHVASYI